MVGHRVTKHFACFMVTIGVTIFRRTIMMSIDQAMSNFENHDFTGLVDVPAAPKAAKPAPTAILEAFKAIKGTHRYDALMCLARNFGKPVSRAKLIAAVYGADADEKAQVGALGMCLEGARKSIKKLDLPYRVVKENATIALVSAN